jgi:hypothetical protein
VEDAIVHKLREHLAGPVDTECKVVYLLCEVRKLLDRYPRGPSQFALRLFCNWALHVDLSRSGTTRTFLERVDRFVLNQLTPGSDTKETFLEEHSLFREFVYLDTFREELSRFLAARDLPTALCTEDKRWFTFLAAYAGVIEDGSLVCEDKGPNKLRIVDKVTFTKGPQRMEDSHVPFGITWDILLKDRRRLEVEVATQADQKFLLFGLNLVKE